MNNLNPQDPYNQEDLGTKQSKKTGKTMLVVAWFFFLGILFVFFQIHENKNNGALNARSNINNLGEVRLTIPITDNNRYEVYGRINGNKTLFLVDTGATTIAVSEDLAAKAGLIKGMPIRVSTAGGMSKAYLTKIAELYIGKDIVLNNVNAMINTEMTGDTVLLGMGALKQLDIQQSNNTLILIQK